MRRIWNFFTPVPYHIDEKELVENCDVLNSAELLKAGYHRWKTFSIEKFPIAKLALKFDDFDADFLSFAGRKFVSEKLRSAMRLDNSGVLYFDVDASRSTPLVRSKNFKIMEVTAVENVSDPEKSTYKMMEGKDRIPPMPSAYSIAMRKDADPAHDLFRDQFFRGLFCTDELAVRVLKAGCIGVRFADPAKCMGSHMRFRTLRGIEESVGWDPVSRTETMELVHSIH